MIKKIVFITGMHRSGTSALAGIFADFGFYAGNNLMPADEDNPTGYWEDLDIFRINNKLLSHLFLSWHELEDIQERRINLYQQQLLNLFSEKASTLIENKLKSSENVVIKDPRFCILFPFWNGILEQISADVSFFHIIRNPLSVASSLQKRNDIPIRYGLLLWYYYNICWLIDLKGSARFIKYDELIRNPVSVAEKLFGKKLSEDQKSRLSKNLNPGLNHYKYTDKELIQASKFLPEISLLWNYLKELSNKQFIVGKNNYKQELIVRDFTTFFDGDFFKSHNLNLVVFPDDDQSSPKTYKSILKQNEQRITFDLNEEEITYNLFSIYVGERPCKVCLKETYVYTNDRILEIVPSSGNYIFCKKNEYFFTENQPVLHFNLNDDHHLKRIVIDIKIKNLDNSDFPLLYPALQSVISERTRENLNISQKILDIDSENRQKQSKIDGYTKKTENLQHEIENYQQKLLNLNSENDQQRSTIENYKSKIDGYTKKTENLQHEIEDYKQKIFNLNCENNQQQSIIDGHIKKIKNLQHEIEDYQQKILNYKKDLSKHQSKIDMLEKKSLWLYNEFNAAKASLSWRITAPLRTLQNLLKRIQKRLYIIVNYIGAGYRILQREGICTFARLVVLYLRGKQLKVETESSKAGSGGTAPQKSPKIEISQKLVFVKQTSPKVTIIIPIFNNALITYRCLKSVLAKTSGLNYEVIVIDDHSTEDISLIKTKTSGIKLIHNSENLGFLKSCNKAAAVAKGEYICLLNNDTEVHKDWLNHLVEIMDSDSQVAIAGPKLIYPDERLQEAGGIIWKDASAWNFGKFDDAEKPDYNYLKEVDYISGACLVIRKQVWLELNGFDVRFAPAYYEDTDLAMQVRKADYKVMYQPLSVVTHHEGLSNGTDENVGLKKNQTLNRDKFLKKWDHTLNVEHSPNGMNVFFHRDRSLRKKHLLVIDHYVPMYDQDAGSRSTFSYLKLFVKMGFKIHFIGDNYFKHEPYTTVLQQMGIEVLYGNYYKKNIRDWFHDNGRYIDFVITHRVHIAPKYFEMIRKFTSAKIAYVGHDLQYKGSQRKFEVTGNKKFEKESKAFLKTETWIFNTVDVILPFSTYEEPHIKKLAPDKNVQVIPVYFFENIPKKVLKFGDRRDILFVGYFGHPPNPDAILWFVNEIFPLVKKQIPDIKLHVVGSHPTKEVLKLHSDSINVTGFVSDEELINFYRSCKIAILPLRFGAGVKGKLLESLYHQIPTVITKVAAEGIQEIENYSMIADDAEEFANKIIKLYNQEEIWESYSKNGRVFIEKHFTEKAAREILEEVLDI